MEESWPRCRSDLVKVQLLRSPWPLDCDVWYLGFKMGRLEFTTGLK